MAMVLIATASIVAGIFVINATGRVAVDVAVKMRLKRRRSLSPNAGRIGSRRLDIAAT